MLLEREIARAVEPELEAPEPEPERELPPLLAIAGMIVVLTLLAGALISVCFLAAKLATGHAV
jgi:hypothetical protein